MNIIAVVVTYNRMELLKRNIRCLQQNKPISSIVIVNNGYAHKDYGRANILFQKTPNGITIEIVDLNRMYIGPIDMKTGCKNFERLPATPQMHRWMAEEYAKARNFDVEKCFELMRAYRSVQPGKIDNLY